MLKSNWGGKSSTYMEQQTTQGGNSKIIREREREKELHVIEREKGKVLHRGGDIQIGFWEAARCAIARNNKKADLGEKKIYQNQDQSKAMASCW